MTSASQDSIRDTLIAFVAQDLGVSTEQVADRTLVALGTFKRFRDWLRTNRHISRGTSFEWRTGFTIEATLWLFRDIKQNPREHGAISRR